MKTKYPSVFGVLAAVMLVASFVVPMNFSTSEVQADPGICKWDTLSEPGALYGTWVVHTGNGLSTDPVDIALGSDDTNFYVILRATIDTDPGAATDYQVRNVLLKSGTRGVFWGLSAYTALCRTPQWGLNAHNSGLGVRNLFQVVVAPDNPQYVAVTSDNTSIGTGPREVWVSQNGGSAWQITNMETFLNSNDYNPLETIRTIDISVDYGGRRDLGVGTADGAGGGRLIIAQSAGFAGWVDQSDDASYALITLAIDFFAIKFSPSYPSDAAIAAVYADAANTYYNVLIRDLSLNWTRSQAFTLPGVEVNPDMVANSSPSFVELNRADLELPSDFSGQAASLRRAYVSTDVYQGVGVAKPFSDGIMRFDNSTPYSLMNTTDDPNKSIYSIAYFGTYASGKLLAGDRIGYPCDATVPTYFTDSPTTCPIPCWYDALKPTTGAANQGECDPTLKDGVGAAIVNWRHDGVLAIALTSSMASENGTTWFGAFLVTPIGNDESAFAISRNNGETWNQLSIIDTTINKFTDIAPTADCKTIYLASINDNDPDGCEGFDSVWRTSSNVDVVSPLAPYPVGTYWERVFTHVTAHNCEEAQTNVAILRTVPYCDDPTGEIVAWAAYDTTQRLQTGVAAWSPDFGDYWAMITVRNPVQDFVFESRTMLYFLSPGGLVQKMPYTGTAWSSAVPDIDAYASVAHTIAAYPEGKVLVGWGYSSSAAFAVSYSANMNTDAPTFAVQALAGATGRAGNMHVAFHPLFDDNGMFFIAEENSAAGAGGCVYRNSPSALLRWADTNMTTAANGAFGCPDPDCGGYTGVVLAFTGEALYVSDDDAVGGVWRTIDDGTGKFGPLSGMPKPGIAWDQLTTGLGAGVVFTLQPTALKACGCCTLETDTSLYAIDDRAYGGPLSDVGNIWGFTDCLAKRGPELITEDKTLIGCDPVSGRAQEVNLCWEQLCVADCYDIEIAKNTEFSIRVLDWMPEDYCCSDGAGLVPVDVTIPCVYIPAGGSFSIGADSDDGAMGSAVAFYGQLECGHTYFWRVKARACATGQDIRSPWSETRQFTVKAGLPVTTPYYGPQLLAPNNGCLGCPTQPASFSWSPFKETTKYKFVLAKDAAMTQIVKEAEVTTTAFEYDGTLDYSTNYFWRVMSLEPAPSDWSATFSFQTESAPPPEKPADKAPPTPFWVWVVIAIGAILVIVTLVLIFKTRRV